MTYAIDSLARHTEQGMNKYGEDNWRLGQPLRQYIASAMRHLLKLTRGETDEDHAAATLWNIAAFIETLEMIRLNILPESLNDLRDYTTREGFDRTVREPTFSENKRRARDAEKLEQWEIDQLIEKEYGLAPSVKAARLDLLRCCADVLPPAVPAVSPEILAGMMGIEKPVEWMDLTPGQQSEYNRLAHTTLGETE